MELLNSVNLSPWSAFVVLLVTLIGYNGIATYLSYRKLSHIKGPWLASFSPFWLFYQTVRGRVYLAGQEALLEYGTDLCDVFIILKTNVLCLL
jgi:hypothetical protein